MTRKERQEYGRKVTRLNKKFETFYYPKVKKAIEGEISSLIDSMKGGVNTDYFNRIHSNTELSKVMMTMYKQVGVFHANRVTRELRREKGFRPFMDTKGFGFNVEWVTFIMNYFRTHLVQYITFGTVETMRKYFLPIISKAISEGTPYAELTRIIEESGFARWQAARIVRTEVNGAANLGTRAAGETYEYQTQKEWISASDQRVRGKDAEDHADHWHLDGQVVDFNQPFTDPKNGVKLMQPGDPDAKGGTRRMIAGTVINCRCTHALIGKRDSEGMLIEK